MSQSQLIDLLVRTTAMFAAGWVVSQLWRHDAKLRSWIWTLCFIAPVAMVWPWPEIYLPIARPEVNSVAITPTVYELRPGFDGLTRDYRGDPPIGGFVIAFALAAAVGLAVLGWRLLITLRLVRSAEQVTDAWLLDELYDLALSIGLKDAPMLKRSDEINSPCVWGIAQPVVLIPARWTLDASSWRTCLEHELWHLAQRDPLRLTLFEVLRALLWWNPLIWMGFRDAALAQEQQIDLKLGASPHYRDLLVGQLRTEHAFTGVRLRGSRDLLVRVRDLARPRAALASNMRLASLIPIAVLALPFEIVAPYRPDPNRLGDDEFISVKAKDGISRLRRMAHDGRSPSDLPDLFINVGVPNVSADGEWLAYNRTSEGGEDIYIARINGTGERLLVASPARDIQPRWSPDGTRLVYCTLLTGSWEVGMIDVASGRHWLITTDGKKNLEPAWHPSGERIVFSSHRTLEQKLWSMNPDGTDLIQLTHGGREDTHGRYSRDGRFLLYSSLRRSKYEATILDLATGIVQPLVPQSTMDTAEPEFVDNERGVVATHQTGTKTHLARIDLADFKFRVISDGEFSMWPATK